MSGVVSKGGCEIGNTEVDKKGDSPVFPLGPRTQLWNEKKKLFKWAQILLDFRKT